jgi:hypothetical protein
MEFANISSSAMCSAIYLQLLRKLKYTQWINKCRFKDKTVNYFDDNTGQILTFVGSLLS